MRTTILLAVTATALGYLVGTLAFWPRSPATNPAEFAEARVRAEVLELPPGDRVDARPRRDSPPAGVEQLVSPEPAQESGAAAIFGFVRTERFEPVGGALIRATPAVRGLPVVARLRTGLEPRGARAAHHDLARQYEAANTVETRSAADGSYRIEGLAADWVYRVSAERAGMRFRTLSHRIYVHTDRRLDVLAMPRTTLRVGVDAPGELVDETLELHLRAADGARSEQPFPAEGGEVAVRPGRYFVHAVAPASGLASATVAVDVSSGEDSVRLELGPRTGIRGAFDTSQGVELARLDGVFCRLVEGGVEPSNYRMADAGEAAHIHEDGRFEILEIEPGDYVLGVEVDGAWWRTRVTVNAGEITHASLTPPDR